jgi:hypothetical protein
MAREENSRDHQELARSLQLSARRMFNTGQIETTTLSTKTLP